MKLYDDSNNKVTENSQNESKEELIRNYVANFSLGSLFDCVSRENQQLIKRTEEMEVV